MDDTIFFNELIKLRENFLIRQYPESIINKAFDKVQLLNRSDIIQYKLKNVQNWQHIPFITTFSNLLVSDKDNNIYKVLAQAWNQLSSNFSHLGLPKIVFRKGRSLSGLLTSTQFPQAAWTNKITYIINNVDLQATNITVGGSSPCNGPRCKTCSILTAGNSIRSSYFDKLYNLADNLNCNSANIIYVIRCSKCKIQYVGETRNPLRERMKAHRSCIKLNRDTPIGIHFNSIDHNITHLQIMPIEQLKTDNITDRKR